MPQPTEEEQLLCVAHCVYIWSCEWGINSSRIWKTKSLKKAFSTLVVERTRKRVVSMVCMVRAYFCTFSLVHMVYHFIREWILSSHCVSLYTSLCVGCVLVCKKYVWSTLTANRECFSGTVNCTLNQRTCLLMHALFLVFILYLLLNHIFFSGKHAIRIYDVKNYLVRLPRYDDTVQCYNRCDNWKTAVYYRYDKSLMTL